MADFIIPLVYTFLKHSPDLCRVYSYVFIKITTYINGMGFPVNESTGDQVLERTISCTALTTQVLPEFFGCQRTCLLYTSDAADE